MSRWFRVYDDLVDDPKVQRLSAGLFRAWMNLLCLASKNNGSLPCLDDIAYKLRVTTVEAEAIIDALVSAELLDKRRDCYSPHNWDKRQFKSDVTDPTNNERQKRWRNRQRNGETVTVKRPDTETDTDTDTESESKSAPSGALPAKEAKRESTRRGSRIPDGWCPSPHDREFASALGWEDARIDREAESFRDYWTAASGQRATKLDWSATWRIWVRRAHEDHRPGSAMARHRAEPSGEHVRAALTAAELYRRSKARDAGTDEAGAGGPTGDADHGVHGAFLRPEDGGVGAIGCPAGLVPDAGRIPAVGGGIRYRPVVIEGAAEARAEVDPGFNPLRRAQS